MAGERWKVIVAHMRKPSLKEPEEDVRKPKVQGGNRLQKRFPKWWMGAIAAAALPHTTAIGQEALTTAVGSPLMPILLMNAEAQNLTPV